MPAGVPGKLRLLVSVRHGGHERVRTLEIDRVAPAVVELHTADSRVVPSGTTTAWIRVAGTAGEPLAGAAVTVSLLEGGVARHRQKARTDAGGIVMARVPIPRVDEPSWSWVLRAEADAEGASAAEVTLTAREEIPGRPTLSAAWQPPPAGVFAGERVPFALRVRDATGQPLVGHDVRYWIGARGTAPPKDDRAWLRESTLARTDGAGEIAGTRDAPTLVGPKGAGLVLLARAIVEGHALEHTASVDIGVPQVSFDVTPEGREIVPGLSQRLFVRILDGHGDGIAATFAVEGDGLAGTFTTNAEGEAEIVWSAPEGVGANRDVGPCAGGVAAAVRVRPVADVPALRARREPLAACVPVDRDAPGLARVEPDVARPGERVRVVLARSPRARRARAGVSVTAVSREHGRAVTGWMEQGRDGSFATELTLPADAPPGMWDVSVSAGDTNAPSRVAVAPLLVAPRALPLLEAKRVGGRATPGGTVEIDARLTDGHGKGMPGAVSAIVVDAFGGGTARVGSLDTRTRLCNDLGAPGDRCTAVLEREPATDALRRGLFGEAKRVTLDPANDPGARASAQLDEAFAAVLRSLEGAVYEAATAPDRLLDVRRKENGRWVFNPELFTLVTDAMPEPPETPGGERLVLADLVQVDPQVTFDVVARRVSRLKLFRVLAAIRSVRMERRLDPDEPLFRDPNALLRRLVREGTLSADMLVDPWGGTIQFVRSAGPPVPFLGVVRGFELHAPGPDGVAGTTDDVRDPFERVVRSGSPYARATDEDRVVDAKWDMVVSEETVSAWQQTLEEATGTALGGEGGIGLGGIGTGGGGSGSGIGHGRGAGRLGRSIATGDAHWSPPARTDAEGRVRLSIPLGDAETTWHVALVGVPDGHGPASTLVPVPSDLPLSARVDVGARWVDGDEVHARVVLRNRTEKAVRATVSPQAEGVALLTSGSRAHVVDVPARGARTVTFGLRAKGAGRGALVLRTTADGLPEDLLRHTWEVIPAGERRALTQTAWVEGERALGLALDHGYVLAGSPRLVLERGYDDAVAAALDALEPERQLAYSELADAMEASIRVARWAETRSTPRHRALAGIARTMSDRALGRFNALEARAPEGAGPSWTTSARIRALTKTPTRDRAEPAASCPPDHADDALEVEPAPAPSTLPCWGAHVANVTRALGSSHDAEAIARAVLALAERPHHAALAAQLADRLRSIVQLDATGSLGAMGLGDRADRATIYAALLRAQRLGRSPASADALFGKLAPLRDVTGGYGSTAATLYVLRALLASQLEGHGATRARVRGLDGGRVVLDRRLDVPASGSVTVPMPAGSLDVQVETEGPGLVARFERPVMRLWSRPPPPQGSPVRFDVVWPANVRAGQTAPLRIVLQQDVDQASDVDVRVPLPPGVALAAPVIGASELQGALLARRRAGRDREVIEVPLRFGLAGKVTVPEATARPARSVLPAATAPARGLVVR